ncbi:MAG: DUF2807 domain-containing protein [Chitinophagaceae bacterium]|nr:MAG: DUF2807 domain-containing protein [Chitinophagaceae bacterium]
MIRKVSVVLVFNFLLLARLFGQTILEDPNVEVRLVSSSFSSIKIQGNLEVWLSQDAVESVAVSSDDVLDIPAIKTEVVDGVLVISGGRSKMKNRGRAYISFKTLEKLELSGLIRVDVSGSVQQSKLALSVSGVSEFSGSVALNNLSLDASGVSKIRLAGKVENVSVISSGTSKVDARDLQAERATVVASGTAAVEISVSKELTVTASGSAKISYQGNPLVHQNLSGVSKLEKKG